MWTESFSKVCLWKKWAATQAWRMLGIWIGREKPSSWGAEGIKSEKGTKGTSWVTRQVFQKQKPYSSRFLYGSLILKRVLSHFFPSSLEGGHFSAPCRRADGACKDCPNVPAKGGTSSPRGDNLGCTHGIFYDYFLGSVLKTTSRGVGSKAAQWKTILLKK